MKYVAVIMILFIGIISCGHKNISKTTAGSVATVNGSANSQVSGIVNRIKKLTGVQLMVSQVREELYEVDQANYSLYRNQTREGVIIKVINPLDDETCNTYGGSQCITIIQKKDMTITDVDKDSFGDFQGFMNGYAAFGYQFGEGDGCHAASGGTYHFFRLDSLDFLKAEYENSQTCNDCIYDPARPGVMTCKDGDFKVENTSKFLNSKGEEVSAPAFLQNYLKDK